ncbi:hypothetical protein LGK97_17895 [Clostridium sp. CS001]|uniref:hypothetical protein n=1 Tax=Clostridium sp. CS001 TaxID=2880648 RepID=UPI001CF22AB0|nr:hypothetical protein [Clostridium sp. CS001]MCB2291590.1 hypothetical protein [Clostridium sp. CS001]
MKMYSLYEFPKDEQELNTIIQYVDKYQPVQYEKLLDIISETIVKANSRTNITLKTLRKIGLIEGDRLISLSPTTQIYLDLNKSLQDLILYLIYLKKDLFEACKLIFKITYNATISNTDLIRELSKIGYLDSKRTAQEKVYAIKRLISMCQKYDEHNPFHEYEEYISFLVRLQSEYFLLGEGKKNEPIPIEKLKRAMIKCDLSGTLFDENFSKLYNDPIYSMHTSFTTVINEFAREKYYKLLEKDYYYFKLSDLIVQIE